MLFEESLLFKRRNKFVKCLYADSIKLCSNFVLMVLSLTNVAVPAAFLSYLNSL